MMINNLPLYSFSYCSSFWRIVRHKRTRDHPAHKWNKHQSSWMGTSRVYRAKHKYDNASWCRIQTWSIHTQLFENRDKEGDRHPKRDYCPAERYIDISMHVWFVSYREFTSVLWLCSWYDSREGCSISGSWKQQVHGSHSWFFVRCTVCNQRSRHHPKGQCCKLKGIRLDYGRTHRAKYQYHHAWWTCKKTWFVLGK